MAGSDGIVILGAGLSGLAAAQRTGSPIYEAESRPGGVAVSDHLDGFVFDRGIHILQTRNETVLKLIRALGINMLSHRRNAYIYFHGKYTAYPFQVNTAGLPIHLRLRCLAGFFNRHSLPEPTNYEQWIYRSVGSGFAETFLIPYSEKFWTVHPREMTFEWTGNRVPQPNLWQVLRGAFVSRQTRIGTNVDFSYPGNAPGYGAIGEAMAKDLSQLHLGHKATLIDTARRTVCFNDNLYVPYEVLISTIPLPTLIGICPDAPAEVRGAVAQLRANSICVVNLGIAHPSISDKHWVHFPEKDICFFRISYPHNFADNVAPPGMSSISAEVAYSSANPIDSATIVDRVIDDLIRVKALDKRHPIILKSTRNIPYGYCIYDMNRKSALDTIHAWLAKVGIIPAGRYGLWTYFWSDEAILSGLHAAENVMVEKSGTVNLSKA